MELQYLLLGWLLGLLGPSILVGIKNEYRLKEIKKGIIAELTDVQFKMANIAYYATLRFGDFDRELNDWLISIIEEYEGVYPNNNLLELLKKQSTVSESEFSAIVSFGKSEAGKGLSVKKYRLPYTESKIADFALFSQDFQRLVLDVLANMHLYNEEVDESRFYFRLSYEANLSTENHNKVISNGNNSYKVLGERAKIKVESINKLEQINR